MKYVVLGASAAGISGAKRLRELDADAEIVLISTDTHVYSRCILHHYIEGIRNLEQLSFITPDFMDTFRIDWVKGETATGVDTTTKTVYTSSGKEVSFDKLLIATGSHVFFPPIPGLKEASNAIGFHDLDECEEILAAAKDAKNIVIMGAGLVGIDAATGLLHAGKKVSLVEMQDRMLPIQLDHHTAGTYQKAFEELGLTQYYETSIQSLDCEDGKIIGLTLSSGQVLPCDLLIVASGVRSNVAFLEGSGIETDRFGLVIDEKGQTSHTDVYGAGDVTGRNPIWPIAVKEGIIAASNMAGHTKVLHDFFASKSTMNFLGIPTMSLGTTIPADDTFLVETECDAKGNYKKIVHKNGKIYGALLQGDLAYAGVLTQLIKEKIDVSRVKKPLFNIDYSDFFNLTENLEFTYHDED